MTTRLWSWVLFLACLLLLSLSATPYSATANYVLVSVRLTLVAVLSILIVRERWSNRQTPAGKDASTMPDAGEAFLGRWRRWYHDDRKP